MPHALAPSAARGLLLALALAFAPAAASDTTAGNGRPMLHAPPAPPERAPAAGDAMVPGERAFFDWLGLRVPAGEQAAFVLGDNVRGYVEGRTHAWGAGTGYRIGDTTLLRDHAALRDGVPLDRGRDALGSVIQPWGVETSYAGAREALMLHAGAQAMSLCVEADAAARLALAPRWDLPDAPMQMRTDRATDPSGHDVLLLGPAEGPQWPDARHPAWVAVAADRPVRIVALERAAHARLGLAPDALAPVFELAEPGRRLTLHLALADTPEAAAALARELAARDAWGDTRALHYRRLVRSHLATGHDDWDRAVAWAKASALMFLVEEHGPGLWAGLPWFRDNWGRDTFIALPGTTLVGGAFDAAEALLANFARFQQRGDLARERDYGRVPNRVSAGTTTLYNTVDGTPWMVREALETLRYTGGGRAEAARLLPLVEAWAAGALAHHVDADGLLTHDDADTWMDARIDGGLAWSPRGDRAVEIQALWFEGLRAGAAIARLAGDEAAAARFEGHATRARAAFARAFVRDGRVVDRVRADGRADARLRPNMLMLASIPLAQDADARLLDAPTEAAMLREAANTLLFAHGIASLDPAHPDFHPRHEDRAPGPDGPRHHKDAAYHNGTPWGWNAGFTITALARHGQQDHAWALSRELGRQILEDGVRGSMSELVDAAPGRDGRPVPSGTYAQSWSVAEFARTTYQDFAGFRPDLTRDTLAFVPAPPAAWRAVRARLPYGRDERLDVHLAQGDDGAWTWTFAPIARPRTVSLDLLDADGGRHRVAFAHAGRAQALRWDGRAATLDGTPLATTPVFAGQAAVIGTLRFATPPTAEEADDPARWPALRARDALRHAIEAAGPGRD